MILQNLLETLCTAFKSPQASSGAGIMHTLLCLLLAALAQAGNISEELKDLGTFTTLLEQTEKAGLTPTFAEAGPFTVFAPTDEAFRRLALEKPLDQVPVESLKKIVQYHVVPGKVYSKDLQNDLVVNSIEGIPIRINIYNNTVTVNGATVEKADIEASNGIIHVVGMTIDPIPTATVAGLVANDPRFSTLLAAVTAAGLADTLAATGPFTVFAPTNAAFAKIPKEKLDALLANKEDLTKVLLRHVVAGTLFEAGLTKGERFTMGGNTTENVINISFADPTSSEEETEDDDTKENESSEVSAESSHEQEDGEVVKVTTVAGAATVIEADILALNGVVHAIDNVI